MNYKTVPAFKGFRITQTEEASAVSAFKVKSFVRDSHGLIRHFATEEQAEAHIAKLVVKEQQTKEGSI